MAFISLRLSKPEQNRLVLCKFKNNDIRVCHYRENDRWMHYSYPIEIDRDKIESWMYLNHLQPSASEWPILIANWHHKRNLIDGSNDQAQFVKLIEEAGELAGAIARGCVGPGLADHIGDMIVVLINIATRNGMTIDECMKVAWDDIKHRKGKMVNGVFIKESDLPDFE